MHKIQNKKGVSLIAVLLFMLVATIAATATFKWLSSEGRSSGSRMMLDEARQSAVAGIENARSWMTFHANDVGSLIKQYADGGNKPILLNNQLKELARANQNFDVWLVGVNTENSSYKLKILSSGKSRNGSTHNEVAIFNVDGLYRINIPQKQTTSTLDFEYAYFAGSYNTAGDVTFSSAVVNGDWEGNPQEVTENLIITGNATLSGNNVKMGKLACIGGDFDANNGFEVDDIYVEGRLHGQNSLEATIKKNLYIGGTFEQGDKPTTINGSVTVDGFLYAKSDPSAFQIDGNLCTTNEGLVVVKNLTKGFSVGGNVWMPGDLNLIYAQESNNCICDLEKTTTIWYPSSTKKEITSTGISCSSIPNQAENISGGQITYAGINKKCELVGREDNNSSYQQIVLGSNTNSLVYIKSGHPSSDYVTLRNSKTFYEGSSTNQLKQCTNQQSRYPNGGCCFEWGYWTNYSYSPYVNVSAANDKYYMYYVEPGVTDVEFKNYHNDYWYNYCDYTRTPYTGGSTGDVYSYFVGNNLYFDMYNVYNYYHYDDSKKNFGSPYCKESGNSYRPECHVAPWFKSNGTVKSTEGASKNFECAESVKDKCDERWVVDDKCGKKYYVDDPITTGYSSFEPYASKGCAKNITTWGKDLASKLNDCYDENKSDVTKANENLYNGFLVVKVSGATQSGICQTSNGTLDGKFIIIAEDRVDCNQGLPGTTDDSFVFLYLTKGASYINKTAKHYFIYSLEGVDWANGIDLTGTFFTPASTCTGIKKAQGVSVFTVDKPLLKALGDASIVCNKGAGCGGSTSGSSSGGTETTSTSIIMGGFDSYYIANAPTLSISLESQYKSTESLPTASNSTTLAKDFIVLPRVIYLAKDAYGQLSDYYKAIPLNGMKQSELNNPTVTCSGSLPVSGKLYDRSSTSTPKLAEGLYNCSYASNGKTVPFYVIVDGEEGSAPYINFTESYVKMATTSTATVSVNIPAHDGPFTLAISKPSNMDNWTFTANNSTGCDGNVCKFTVAANSSATTLDVFTVSTNNAGNGTAMFSLQDGEGYNIGSPSTQVLDIASSVTINREEATEDEIKSFCTNNPDCPSSLANWPNCTVGSDIWVTANGDNCGTSEANKKWFCGVSADISLQKVASPSGCVVIIPTENNTIPIADLETGATKSLRASVKAEPISFQFGFSSENTIEGTPTIRATVKESSLGDRINSTYIDCPYDPDARVCSMSVFSGEAVELSILGDASDYKFNYWSCNGVDCNEETHSSTTYLIGITTSGNKVLAHFNETDKHCFFDEFKDGVNEGTCASNKPYCIGSNSTKWDVEGNLSTIDYDNGYIAIKHNKIGNIITLMSTAVAGANGTLKAQFQVPTVARSNAATLPSSVSNTGFVLHSTMQDATGQYLLLTPYADNAGNLTASLCNNTKTICKTSVLETSSGSKLEIGYSTSTIVTLSVDLKSSGITLTAVTDRFGAGTQYAATFSFDDFADYKIGQYVGFKLGDSGFKLYDIGWKSEDYGSECWDTYPTVNCSFKARYAGGIVPQNTSVTPWVGLSSWFDASGCSPIYYYFYGDDACGASVSSYAKCSGSYSFATIGNHGYTDSDGNEKYTAKAGVESCANLVNESHKKLLAETELGHCGSFWVGTLSSCSHHKDFLKTDASISGGNSESFNLAIGESANVRDATLRIVLENTYSSPLEIYLTSQEGTYSPNYQSKSFVTSATGSVSVAIETLLDEAGFDPEHVYGVTIKNLGSNAVTIKSINSQCPNVISVNCNEDLQYNKTAKQWEFSAAVTNSSRLKSFKISEVNGRFGSEVFDYDCNDGDCRGNNGVYQFSISDNPYSQHQGENYQFKVEWMTTEGEAGEPCNTNAQSVESITRSCEIKATSIQEGNGVPPFYYTISEDCPTTECAYKISLVGNGNTTQIATGSGKANNLATSSDVANGEGDKLTAETKYHYVLESTTPAYPFTKCESAEFEVTKAPSTYKDPTTTCWFGDNGEQRQLGADGHFKYDVLKKASYLNGVPYKLKHTVDGTEVEVASGTTCGNSDCEITIPASPYGLTYTLYLKVNDDYEESCQATLPIKVTSASNCKLEKGKTEMSATESDQFVFDVTNPCTGTVCSYDLVRTLNGITDTVSSGNPTRGQYNPTITGPGVYTVWINGVEQTDCSITVTGKRPSFSCNEQTVEVGSGVLVGITPSNLLECSDGCNYSLVSTTDASFPSGMSISNFSYTGSEISFAARTSEMDETYALTIENANGSTTKNCSVKYKEPGSALCDCKCARGCDGLTPGGNLGETSYDGCYFITEASRLSMTIGNNWNVGDGRYVKINGQNIDMNKHDGVQLCWDKTSDCLTALENYSKVDGGWYIEMNASWVGVRAPSSYDPCAPIEPPTLTSCSGWPSSVKPGKTVSFTPTTTNCNVYGGCIYTITGGSSTITGNYTGGNISFNGESSEGSYTYHVSIKNKGGDGVGICDGSVTFDVNAPEQIFSKGSEISASNGMRVWISESVTGSGLRCYHGYQTGNCTVYIEGSSKVSKTIGNCNSHSGWNYIELPLTSLGSDRIATITFTNVEDGVMKCSVQ